MVNEEFTDYYKVLGVAHDADQKEVQRAFRRAAQRYHPDALKNLPEEERKGREGKMYQVTEAYEVLSDPEKRGRYDRLGKDWQREGETTHAREWSARGDPYGAFFNWIFGESGWIFERDRSWGISPFWWSTTQEPVDYFMIPENDLGLLAALIKAYEAKEDGKWKVKPAETDKRDWLPEELYSVKRKGERVTVFRRVVDWRDKSRREDKIRIRDEERPWRDDSKREMAWDTFLGEYYLIGKGRGLLREHSLIDYGYKNYLLAMKNLARKIARKEKNREGKYDVAEELRWINGYAENAKNTRVEGERLHQKDEDREWVRKVPFEEFWERIKDAEGRVTQVEGVQKTPEGQPKSKSPEGTHPSSLEFR